MVWQFPYFTYPLSIYIIYKLYILYILYIYTYIYTFIYTYTYIYFFFFHCRVLHATAEQCLYKFG